MLFNYEMLKIDCHRNVIFPNNINNIIIIFIY